MAKNFNPETEQKEKEIKNYQFESQDETSTSRVNSQRLGSNLSLWSKTCAWNNSSQPIQVAQDITWKVMGLHFRYTTTSLTRKYLTQLQPLAACTMISPRSPSAFSRTADTHSPPDCAVSSQDASAQKCPSQTVGSCYTSSKSSSHVCSEVSHSFNLRQQKDVNFKVRVVWHLKNINASVCLPGCLMNCRCQPQNPTCGVSLQPK